MNENKISPVAEQLQVKNLIISSFQIRFTPYELSSAIFPAFVK
jgi:hypothetical protein